VAYSTRTATPCGNHASASLSDCTAVFAVETETQPDSSVRFEYGFKERNMFWVWIAAVAVIAFCAGYLVAILVAGGL